LSLLLCVGLFLGQGADVVDQVPILLGFAALTFGWHVLVAVLDDIEDFAIGTVFKGRGIGEIGEIEFHILGGLAFAVAIFAVTPGAIQRPPFFGAARDSGVDFTGFGCLTASTGIAGYVGVFCGVGIEDCCAVSAGAKRKRAGRTSLNRVTGTSSHGFKVAYVKIVTMEESPLCD
jgi:hypothetical protein